MTLEVLIVDDSDPEFIGQSFKEELMKKGYREEDVHFSAASTGDKAIAMTRKNKYVLAVLDFAMPGKNGYTTAKELRKIQEDITLIGFSASWDEDKAKKIGLEMYSVDPNRIIAYIAQKIESTRRRD